MMNFRQFPKTPIGRIILIPLSVPILIAALIVQLVIDMIFNENWKNVLDLLKDLFDAWIDSFKQLKG